MIKFLLPTTKSPSELNSDMKYVPRHKFTSTGYQDLLVSGPFLVLNGKNTTLVARHSFTPTRAVCRHYVVRIPVNAGYRFAREEKQRDPWRFRLLGANRTYERAVLPPPPSSVVYFRSFSTCVPSSPTCRFPVAFLSSRRPIRRSSGTT